MKNLWFVMGILTGSSAFAQESAGSSGAWQWGAGASYSLTSRVRYDSITFTSGGISQTGTGELDFDKGFSLEVDLRNMPANSWGFMGGLTVDLARKEGKGIAVFAGVAQTTEDYNNKLQMTVISANAVYRWNEFYVPFGANLNSPSYNAPNVTTKGGVGAQIGFGYYVNSNVVIEGMSRATVLKQTSADSQGTTDFGTAYFSNLMLTAKYIF